MNSTGVGRHLHTDTMRVLAGRRSHSRTIERQMRCWLNYESTNENGTSSSSTVVAAAAEEKLCLVVLIDRDRRIAENKEIINELICSLWKQMTLEYFYCVQTSQIRKKPNHSLKHHIARVIMRRSYLCGIRLKKNSYPLENDRCVTECFHENFRERSLFVTHHVFAPRWKQWKTRRFSCGKDIFTFVAEASLCQEFWHPPDIIEHS